MPAREPKKIAITGATGNIGYNLLFQVAAGHLFGQDQPVEINLLARQNSLGKLAGTVMEVDDIASCVITNMNITDDPVKAFDGVTHVFLVAAAPRSKGMERSDLILKNGPIFQEAGNALNRSADENAKVLVVGNPANTNALIAQAHAPNINPANFHALMRLDQSRAVNMLAKHLRVSVRDIDRLTVWGNHGPSQFPDLLNARIHGEPVLEQVDKDWYENEFIPQVQQRGKAVIDARGSSSVASAAVASAEHMRLWEQGTNGRVVSFGVPSNGEYGIDPGVIFGMPCVVNTDGEYHIATTFETNSNLSQEMLDATNFELRKEREEIEHLLPTAKAELV